MEMIWKLLAGLAMLLVALRLLEESLKSLAGRPFKRFLRRQTTTPIKGILSGVGITAVLQSSTLVSLMMIAFVGAGILTLSNAIGVIFGANLGTTATGWLIAWLGFDLDIEVIALPMIAVGGLAYVFFEKMPKVSETGRFVLGFGLLFIGLSFMKEAIEQLGENFNLASLNDLHPYLLYPVGILVAGLIHSGSATVVLALSALGAGVLPIEAAAAFVIGGDLGKTFTAILGSLRGTPVQKQVAAAHTLFNLTTNALGLLLMYPLLWVIREVIGLTSSYFTLVALHSSMHVLGILVLLPFVSWIANVLGKRFKGKSNSALYILKVNADVPDAALEALHNEILHLAEKVVALKIEGLGIETDEFSELSGRAGTFTTRTFEEHYNEIKQLHGETFKYVLRIQAEKLEDSESALLSRYAHALNHLLKSAKRLKDVLHNIEDFDASADDEKHALFLLLRNGSAAMYSETIPLILRRKAGEACATLKSLIRDNRKLYEDLMDQTHGRAQQGALTEVELATFYNANHEIYSSNKAYLEALADVLLTPSEIEEFEELPELQ